MNEKKCKCKTRKGKKIFFLSLGLAFLLTAFCGHRMCHKGMHGISEKHINRMVEKIVDELDLDEKQEAKLTGIKEEILTKRTQFETISKETKEFFTEEIKKDSFDAAKINKDLDKNSEKLKEFRVFLVEKFAEFHAILRPEQKKELAEHIEKKKKRCE
ncbi:MAG: Spy/CpxP family protein refolding chaperone [Spirochaetia bacterium]|nr:Spy/CpxP family protein refolding chaperone [Spirochaetia bacterium]